GDALSENGKWEEAGGNSLEAALARAHILAVSGKRSEAAQTLDSLQPLPHDNGIAFRGMALVHVALGEHDRAFEWLEKAYEVRSETLCLMKADPKLAPL